MPVSLMSFFTTIIYIIANKYKVAVGIPLSVLTSVSVALGLLLAFRVNTAYERYNNGRCLIQTVTATIRNLSRQIWINVPEDTPADHLQKMRCVKLLLAFFVATKHHLRREYGTDFYDLQELLPKDWTPLSVTHGAKERSNSIYSVTGASQLQQRGRRMIHKLKKLPLVVSVHDDVKPDDDQAMLQPDHRNDVHNMRRTLIKEFFPDDEIVEDSAPAIQKKVLAEALTTLSPTSSTAAGPSSFFGRAGQDAENDETRPLLVGRHHKPSSVKSLYGDRDPVFASEEDLPDQGDGDLSLPMEIIYRISLYINAQKAAGKIESSFVSVTTSSLDTLVNTLTSFERIVHTPIPKAYNIHLKQGTVLYIFFLPFALVESLGALVIPVVALVSFTLFGILAIGNEIENPFGYDYNDLPLNKYCEDLKREVEYIIYHVPSKSGAILIDGQ
ncbi:UPF0187-domain-containing protein [Hesseltinella vesiculosa]|uniref:UPF0187-domain-containing protein n=1 Tax=Hesseltinella vesiculosa TaxID=101127 RepID=A0A1X2GMB2_9FUNG|nr:UPF0187-domain-containing protein [Hesseltinella vesiculosa]